MTEKTTEKTTEKNIQVLQDRLQRMELENQRLHESLVQAERLDKTYTSSLAAVKKAKREVQASAAMLKGIMDSAMDCIISMDEKGFIVEFNIAAEKMFGYKRDEVLGMELSEAIIPPGLRYKHRQGLQQWLQNRAGNWINKRIETIGMRADGSEFPVELSIAKGEQRGSVLFSGFIRDLTEVKAVDKKLQHRIAEEEETRRAMLFMLEDLNESSANIERGRKEWEQTFDAVTDPIFSHDENFHIVRANRAYAEYAGMRIQDVIGKPYWQVFPKREGPLPGCLRARGKAEAEAEEEIQTENGKVFLSRSYSISGEKGKVYAVHFMEEITERKQHEQSIRDSEEKFRAVSETAQDGIIMLDNEGKISLWNKAAEQMFGYSQDDAMGQKIEQLIIPQRYKKQHQDGFAAFRDTGEGSAVGNTVELCALHRDGSEFPIELSISASKLGNKWHAVGILRDITERRRAEKEIDESRQKLKESLEGTIQAIASAEEVRDPYTAGHQERVAEIACAIGREMGLKEDAIEGIRMGGRIHDIGKIHLPAEILSKPTRLSEIEYCLIQGHSQVGYDILKDIEFPWPVADIAHQHHERIDGSGYPQGLKGKEICLEARIVGVADVVEAMCNDRPYRVGLGIDKALAEIERGCGSIYDTNVANACLHLFREGDFSMADTH